MGRLGTQPPIVSVASPAAGPRRPPATPHMESVRVLFIGGWGRSGSTLLDLLLGQAPGVFSAGEIREIWQSGCVENRPCGCGQAFRSCPFWSRVGKEAFGGWDRLDIERVLRLRYSLDRAWAAPLLFPGAWSPLGRRVDDYVRVLSRLYRAIKQVSGAEVIVDSSNLSSHAMLLKAVPSLDMRVVHLVRDSRGVAFSWKKSVPKRTTTGHDARLPQYGLASSSLRWVLYNGMVELLRLRCPYLFVRYEDVVVHPQQHASRILRHAGLSGADTESLSLNGRTVTLSPNHTVEGNPMRFTSVKLDLRIDVAWRNEMPKLDRRIVTYLTMPMLRRYGYSTQQGKGDTPGLEL